MGLIGPIGLIEPIVPIPRGGVAKVKDDFNRRYRAGPVLRHLRDDLRAALSAGKALGTFRIAKSPRSLMYWRGQPDSARLGGEHHCAGDVGRAGGLLAVF